MKKSIAANHANVTKVSGRVSFEACLASESFL